MNSKTLSKSLSGTYFQLMLGSKKNDRSGLVRMLNNYDLFSPNVKFTDFRKALKNEIP